MSNRKAGRATSIPIDDFWREQMKDPEFKREYDALEPEFSIRRQLIDLRLKHGLSQRQLAERVGTPRPSISRMEAKGVKDLAFAQRLADALDCTLEVRFVPKKRAGKTEGVRRAETSENRAASARPYSSTKKAPSNGSATRRRRKVKQPHSDND
jgi:transcriptional regulator with XRE-family HTH domain